MNNRFDDPQVDFGARYARWKRSCLAVRLLSVVALLGAVGVGAIHPDGHPRLIDAIDPRGSSKGVGNWMRTDLSFVAPTVPGSTSASERFQELVDREVRPVLASGSCAVLQARGDVPVGVVTILDAYRRDFGITTIWPVDAPACVSF